MTRHAPSGARCAEPGGSWSAERRRSISFRPVRFLYGIIRPYRLAPLAHIRPWSTCRSHSRRTQPRPAPGLRSSIAVLKLRVTAPAEDRTNRVREEDQFRLERNSLLALREYVPGSQLLAGGRLIRSRGILKHWTGENIDTAIGLRGQYTKCKNGHLYYWTSGATIPDCPFCREPAGQSPVPYLVPQYGFSSAAWDPPKWSTDQELVGSVETVSATFTPAALAPSGSYRQARPRPITALSECAPQD